MQPISQIPADQFGPVVITPREIYDAVIRVSGKVDAIALQMAAYEHDKTELERLLEAQHRDHEARIRSMEKRMWPLQSVGVLVSAAAVAVAFLVH